MFINSLSFKNEISVSGCAEMYYYFNELRYCCQLFQMESILNVLMPSHLKIRKRMPTIFKVSERSFLLVDSL